MPLFKREKKELQDWLWTANEADFNKETQRIEAEINGLRERKRAIRDERIRRQQEALAKGPDTSHLDQTVGHDSLS